MQKFHAGDTAYLVESNNFIREVQIKRRSGDFWLIVYDGVSGRAGMKVREKRLFATEAEALAHIARLDRSPR